MGLMKVYEAIEAIKREIPVKADIVFKSTSDGLTIQAAIPFKDLVYGHEINISVGQLLNEDATNASRAGKKIGGAYRQFCDSKKEWHVHSNGIKN